MRISNSSSIFVTLISRRCWIKGGSDYENALRVVCYYLWLMLLVFGGAIIYIYIVYKVLLTVYTIHGC